MKLDSEEQQLVAYRDLRDQALALVKDDIEALKLDLELRGVGARIADRVGDEAREVWEQTLDVAAAHRSLVAATLLALVAWLLRGPIASGVGALFGRDDVDADEPVDHFGDDSAAARQSQTQGEPT